MKYDKEYFYNSISGFSTSEAISHEELALLKQLANLIEFDKLNRTIVVRNGESKISLKHDGTVRIEGRTITTAAKDALSISGSFVEIN